MMNGIMHGMHIAFASTLSVSALSRKWPMISVLISRPLHSAIGFFTRFPG